MSPKDNDTLLAQLGLLETTLARLRSYSLPDDLHQDVQESLRILGSLATALGESLPHSTGRLTGNGQSRDRSGQNRLAALYQVSQALGTSLNLDDVLNQVMDSVIHLTGAERGFLVLLDPSSRNHTSQPPIPDTQHLPEHMHVRAARNFSQETLERKDIMVSRTVIHTVLENGSGIVTTDAQNDPRFSRQDSVALYSLRSILCAPLKVRRRIIGVIYVDHRAQSGIFTNEDLSLINAFAAQAAIAIENARLYTRTDQALAARVAELETLTKIDRELNARLDYDHVLEIARHWAILGTWASQCWIALCHPDDREPGALEPAFGDISSTPPCGDLPPEASQVVTEALRSLVLQSMPPDADHPAYLAAPILHSGKPIGVIVVAGYAPPRRKSPRPESFPEPAQQFLARLAGRAANAIENARLYLAVQETNQAKSKFVSLVTHELRIPMTSIKGYTDLIRQGAVGPVSEQQIHFLNIIRNNVDRMSTLVSELTDISRIEAGRMKLEQAFISLPGFIDEAVQNLRQRIEEKNQLLLTSVPENLPRVYADPIRVVQILTNLLSNAWKYTPPGGRITVRASTAKDSVKIEVQDNGLGISLEDQVMLFSQFFRSEDPQVREQQGWGLGLSITRRLVEMMGGEMGFFSRLKEGSSFWFTLPTVMRET
jgi:signal transduction histidine kinase